MDKKDREILDLLVNDGRMTYSDIGEKVGLSRTAVKNRINSMEQSGIIAGYHAVVNPHKSTEMMTYILNMEAEPAAFDNAKEILLKCSEVLALVQTTGKCHLTALCVSEDVRSMRNFVNEMYRKIPDVQYINTSAVLDVLKGVVIPKA